MAEEMAEVLNYHLNEFQRERAAYDEEILDLTKRLKSQKEDLASQKEINIKEVGRLEENRAGLAKQVGDLNAALEAKAGRLSKLEEKATKLKKYLNSATAEQQVIFSTSKATCSKAIEEMKKEYTEHKSMLATELMKSEAAQAQLRSRVNAVVEESRQGTEQRKAPRRLFMRSGPNMNAVNGRIVELEQALTTREAELKSEKATAARLEIQVKEDSAAADKLRSLECLMQDVFQKLDDASLRNEESAKAIRAENATM